MNSLQQINGTWQVQCQDCITVSNNPGHVLQCTCGTNKCLGCCCDSKSGNSEDIWADTNSEEDPDYNPDDDDEYDGEDEENNEYDLTDGFVVADDAPLVYEEGYVPDPAQPENQLEEQDDQDEDDQDDGEGDQDDYDMDQT